LADLDSRYLFLVNLLSPFQLNAGDKRREEGVRFAWR
jgi:hypothetical protein